MKILYILTAPQMVGFLRGQLQTMKKCGFTPVLCAPELNASISQFSDEEGVEVVVCPMCRRIDPWADLKSYLRMVRIIRTIKPDVTMTIGPKAGLIGGLASATCQVSCRIQTKWGIRLETTRGLLRLTLMIADRIASLCAHLVLCDSNSGRERTVELGLAAANKVSVVASGSANGIDTQKFSLSHENIAAGSALRESLGAKVDSPVVGFVGRISQDKGLRELVEAWELIQGRKPGAILAVVGDDECVTLAEKELLERLRALPGVRMLGKRAGMEGIFPAFDVLLMPSHREGFGVVVLEAAAMQVPTVGFTVTGIRDSVITGTTGMLVRFGDISGLAEATIQYLDDRSLRIKHGEAACQRVKSSFRQEQVWQGYFNMIRSTAAECGLNTIGLKWHDRHE